MWHALQDHAAKHALLYAIAFGLGLQAFFTGFYDNFWVVEPATMAKMGWWQKLALLFKSLSFAIGVMVGYLIKPANGNGNGGVYNNNSTPSPTNGTNPPIPQQTTK